MSIALTIITVNLNDSPGLQKTIQSVINQSFDEFEYVVIDGGSSDNSVEVIKRYGGRIKYWVSEKDKGIYNAMNKGLNKATGTFCLFLNSGDYLFADNTLAQVKNFLKGGYDIVYGSMYQKFSEHFILKKYPFPFTLYNFANSSLPHPCSFVRTALLKKMNGYDDEFMIVSDWIFFMRAFVEERAIFSRIDQPISVHNMFGISNRPNQFADEPEKAILKYYPHLKLDFEHLRNLQSYEASTAYQTFKAALEKLKIVRKIFQKMRRNKKALTI